MMLRCLVVLGLLVAGTCPRAVAESVPVLDWRYDNFNVGEATRDTEAFVGWQFEVTAPIRVTDIGWYDDGQDGLVHPHNVDIWRFGEYWSGADPVAVLGPHVGAATGLVIPAGTEAELEDIYRRVPLELGPLTLEPGFYSIAGHVNAGETDPIAYIGGQFSKGTDPRVNRGSAGWRETPDYGPPTIHFLAEGVFLGPIFYVVPVPEPTGWVLMMAAIVVCGTRGRVGRFPHI